MGHLIKALAVLPLHVRGLPHIVESEVLRDNGSKNQAKLNPMNLTMIAMSRLSIKMITVTWYMPHRAIGIRWENSIEKSRSGPSNLMLFHE